MKTNERVEKLPSLVNLPHEEEAHHGFHSSQPLDTNQQLVQPCPPWSIRMALWCKDEIARGKSRKRYTLDVLRWLDRTDGKAKHRLPLAT